MKLPTSKCLSAWEPWATLIVTGKKDIENRVWQTSYRGPLLIHAGKNVMYFEEDRRWIQEALGITVPPRDQLTFGAVIGYVELVDCIYSELGDGRWGQPGCYHWILRNPRSLDTPLFTRGFQKIFNIRL